MDQAQVNETLQRLSAQLNRTTSGSPAFRQLAAQEEAIVFADLDVHAWGFLQAALGRPLAAGETAAVIAAASRDQPLARCCRWPLALIRRSRFACYATAETGRRRTLPKLPASAWRRCKPSKPPMPSI